MIKKLLLPLLLLVAYTTSTAQLNNGWIDYSKTYYKFKISADNICRIPQATLVNAGLGGTNADHFQLWKNGQQVRLFTPVSGVPLGAADYIEFWGEMNDGKPDAQLYKKPEFQLADKYSLETDTATYFLTVNTAGANLRYNAATNPAAGGATPDAYFMRKIDLYYKNQLNLGYGENAGTYVYSSSYDNGEGFTSATFQAAPPTSTAPAPPFTSTQNIAGLNVYTAGPANGLSVRGKVFFNTDRGVRKLNVKVFNNFLPDPVNGDTYYNTSNSTEKIFNYPNQPLSWLTNTSNVDINLVVTSLSVPPSPTATIQPPYENTVIATLGITYPATFNFNNEKSFYFELAPSVSGNYLLIDNFNYGAIAPVLYDINNGRRYVGDIASTPGKVKFVLPSSTDAVRKFILNNIESASTNFVNNITSKTFVNYNTTATRGDYIIISNPALYNDGNGINKVEEYRAYRASTNGGGFNAKIYDINELRDQFSFGIKSHPGAVRDFVRFIDQQYPVKPKYVFVIGRGLTYYDHRNNEASPIVDKLDLVPTFGWPSSDVCMAALPGNTEPIIPIGRIAAVSGVEVGNYLQKIIQYEDAQKSQSPRIIDKAWMKNAALVVGGSNDNESNQFLYYANGNNNPNVSTAYANILYDTLFGGHSETFAKTSATIIQQANGERIAQLMQDGLGIVSYFGHSSADVLEFNLSSPEIYNNTGKYPFFNISGCNAGNFYNFDPQRLTGKLTLSEKYVFAPQKGSIAFLASTHYGIPGDLDRYNQRLFQDISYVKYGQSVGGNIKDIVNNLGGNNPNLFHQQRMHLEEINLHGDPAVKVNNFPKPDYVIEKDLVKITPSIITVADPSFNVKIKMRNIGRAINDSMRVSVKRLLPNTTVPVMVLDTMIKAILNEDSLQLTIPINPTIDNGLSKLYIKLDNTDRISEIYETNNELAGADAIDIFVFENTLTPVYPYNFSIVNTQNITYAASTANPLLGNSNFLMQIDTTELFNSAFKKVYNKTGVGGVIEFTPTNLTFTDSTVYYWRTAVVPATGDTIWNKFSFVYLPNSTAGFNQSHYYQDLKSKYDANIFLDNDRKLKYTSFDNFIRISAANAPENGFPVMNAGIGGVITCQFGTTYNTFQFGVFDGNTGSIKRNDPLGQYNSTSSGSRRNQFEFKFATPSDRNNIVKFIDSMPNNAFIIMYTLFNNSSGGANSFVSSWKSDSLLYGVSGSLYHRFKSYGLTQIDSFYRNVPMIFKFTKDNSSPSYQKVGSNIIDPISGDAPIVVSNVKGQVTSQLYGPAKTWGQFHWRGSSMETPTKDMVSFDVIGVNNSGVETVLMSIDSTMKDVDISAINVVAYPFLKVKMTNIDSAKATPYQLRYWRVNYTPIPEGAIAPNLLFTMKDTVDVGEPINFAVAFKNIGKVNFDSLMKISLRIRTNNNFDSVINIPKGKILIVGDTLKASYTIPSENFIGNNTLQVEFNPNSDQQEQFHFNNILYKNFYVKGDVINPLLDVTFDGVHILNKDIVSSKPDILIKLKDENKFLGFRMQDTALLKVQIKYPGQANAQRYYFNNDTMRFNPANLSAGENTATINLKPNLLKDGDYELTVTGKDRSGNTAGALDYHTTFSVINKAMISEMLNYPNPFTTSTAFVFTLTGSEIPQNLRIQVLTITGKVVREITKQELGPIHVGRNITEFKWDGTDMYGQKLANGVYIYRIITNLNGKSLEKYKAEGDDTHKYFNKGYGKMYLMR
jgi:Peptidase family C25